MENRFNIRVYGLIVYHNHLLITDEFRLGMPMTKFPGGGLHFGEGTIGCLERECLEELKQEVEITGHYYTTDFFQPSLYLPEVFQMISIYYKARLKDVPRFITSQNKEALPEVEGAQVFRWIPLGEINPACFTLPIDKTVAVMIMKNPASLPDSE